MWESIIIVGIVFAAVTNIVKMSLKHKENIERIRHGYPEIESRKKIKEVECVDMTMPNKERLQ